jgi:REP element-mobilizing transposase RayT
VRFAVLPGPWTLLTVTRFKNTYRIESTRLRNWDYTAAAWYFGGIANGEMALSPIGIIVDEEWRRTATLRPAVKLDEWVIMPNHLHGIIVIEPAASQWPNQQTLPRETPQRETPQRGVSTGWAAGSLGAIVGQVKGACTKRIHASGCLQFDGQSRFYDHIIRGQAELDQIRSYIRQNPLKWQLDRYYSVA